MAMSTRGKRSGPTAEINVTPMADIMIVLLIIFMVATPLIARSDVTLPHARNARETTHRPVVVVLKLDRSLTIEGSRARDVGPVSTEVRSHLGGMAEGTRLVHLKADAGLPYAEVARVMDMLRALGADEVALMTSPRPEA
jgi:biopolymer transport protein TolR